VENRRLVAVFGVVSAIAGVGHRVGDDGGPRPVADRGCDRAGRDDQDQGSRASASFPRPHDPATFDPYGVSGDGPCLRQRIRPGSKFRCLLKVLVRSRSGKAHHSLGSNRGTDRRVVRSCQRAVSGAEDPVMTRTGHDEPRIAKWRGWARRSDLRRGPPRDRGRRRIGDSTSVQERAAIPQLSANTIGQ
jgi:hypothetical protein